MKSSNLTLALLFITTPKQEYTKSLYYDLLSYLYNVLILCITDAFSTTLTINLMNLKRQRLETITSFELNVYYDDRGYVKYWANEIYINNLFYLYIKIYKNK